MMQSTRAEFINSRFSTESSEVHCAPHWSHWPPQIQQ